MDLLSNHIDALRGTLREHQKLFEIKFSNNEFLDCFLRNNRQIWKHKIYSKHRNDTTDILRHLHLTCDPTQYDFISHPINKFAFDCKNYPSLDDQFLFKCTDTSGNKFICVVWGD